ncbi:hypothetical protein [Petrachloros mirabilis]
MIEGLEQLKHKLNALETLGSQRIALAAARGMVTPIKGAIRRGVNSATAPPAVKRAARMTIGSTVKKNLNGYGMKAGFGVGKQSKAKRPAATTRAKGKKTGLGISSRNIHWLVFGTGEGSVLAGTRFKTAGSDTVRKSKAKGRGRETKKGKGTGSTSAYFKGVLPAQIVLAIPQATERAALKAAIQLQNEASKGR